MKLCRKLVMALCLALAACLVVPVALPANLSGAVSAQAASKKITLNKSKASVYNGKTLKLTVKNTKKKVIWSSSDPSVATVNTKGVVTAKKVGQTKITAKVNNSEFTCVVTVKPSLTADATNVTINKGSSKNVTITWQLSGKFSLSYDNAAAIKCSLGKIKNKKAKLTIKALQPGVSTITLKNAKTNDVVTIKVTVPGGSTPSAPIVDKTTVTLNRGGSVKINVTWPYAVKPYVEFNPDVLKVSWGTWTGTGWPLTINGVKSGKDDVTLSKGEEGEKVATISVTVK